MMFNYEKRGRCEIGKLKRGQVYYADLRPVVGSEQGGIRPCLIIQNDMGNTYSPTVIVATMTTQKKNDLPTHIAVSPDDCVDINTTILLEQIRTIDKSRLSSFVGRLSENTMKKVDEALHISPALNKEERKEETKLNELQIFEKEDFGSIRTVMVDGEPWFVASDICKSLDIANTTQAVQRLDDDEKSMLNIGLSGGATNCVNEYGLYNLILASRKKEAKEFKRWITHEVIPQIRQAGGYQKKLSPQEMMRIQLGMIDNHEERIANLENNMTIDYGQQRVLEDTVNKTVIDVLGGKGSDAYKEVGRKVFAECNRDLKHYFDVNARNNVPKKRFDEAVEYARNWKPCTNTMILISDCNAQMVV